MLTKAAFSRAGHYAARRIDYLKSRFSGEFRSRTISRPVLINSIPKAGTHLLETALSLFPGILVSGQRTIRGASRSNIIKKINRIPKGVVATSHLKYEEDIYNNICEKNIILFQMIRDPRDVVVSRYKYLSEVHSTHKGHKHFRGLRNEDDKLMLAITGMPHSVVSIRDVFLNHSGWLEKFECCVVRFEALIGVKGGGTEEEQVREVDKIARHLGIDLDEGTRDNICRKSFNPDSLTFRSPKVSGWKDHFKAEHVGAFKEHAGDLLDKFGYR